MTDLNRQMAEFVSQELGWPIYEDWFAWNRRDGTHFCFGIFEGIVKHGNDCGKSETWSPRTDHNHLAVVKRALQQQTDWCVDIDLIGDTALVQYYRWIQNAEEKEITYVGKGKGDHAENDAVIVCAVEVMKGGKG